MKVRHEGSKGMIHPDTCDGRSWRSRIYLFLVYEFLRATTNTKPQAPSTCEAYS